MIVKDICERLDKYEMTPKFTLEMEFGRKELGHIC
jgi:hypothetical protein